eukprot:1628772-Prymnesium_polylepis.1
MKILTAWSRTKRGVCAQSFRLAFHRLLPFHAGCARAARNPLKELSEQLARRVQFRPTIKRTVH